MIEEEASHPVNGLSPSLTEKMEGISRWLFEHQQAIADQFGECTSFRVDSGTTTLRVGDVLFDEWEADILCSVGIWRPESGEFLPSVTDENCPDAFAKPLRDQLAEDACLRDISEFSEPIVNGVIEVHAWALAGVAAMSFEAQGVHVAETGGDFIFLVVNNLRRAPEAARILDEARVAHLICEAVGPVLDTFYAVMDEEDSEEADDMAEMLMDGIKMLGEYLSTCHAHAEMTDSPLAHHFGDIAERCSKFLERTDKDLTEEESMEAITELVDFQLYLNELYEHYRHLRDQHDTPSMDA